LKIHSLIIDNFLRNPEEFREIATSRSFDGITNPHDGIHYPNVTLNIPVEIQSEITQKLQAIFSKEIKYSAMFMRLRKEGMKHAPHEVHSDKIMGDYTALIYLNTDDQCRGGTAFVEHISGQLSTHPETPEELELWHQDTNRKEAWVRTGFCPMKFNRCVIFRSDLLHYAEPWGGFGTDNDSGRLVLTAFFSVLT